MTSTLVLCVEVLMRPMCQMLALEHIRGRWRKMDRVDSLCRVCFFCRIPGSPLLLMHDLKVPDTIPNAAPSIGTVMGQRFPRVIGHVAFLQGGFEHILESFLIFS